MSESHVTRYVVHSETDERVRCTREGARELLEAQIVVLVDEDRGYRQCITAATMRSGSSVLESTSRRNVTPRGL